MLPLPLEGVKGRPRANDIPARAGALEHVKARFAPAQERRVCPDAALRRYITVSHLNPSPQRLMCPRDGEGKCAKQHSVLLSQ